MIGSVSSNGAATPTPNPWRNWRSSYPAMFRFSNARVIVVTRDLSSGQGQVSAGWLWSTGNRWQWCVWSIAGDGTLAFSSWREIFL